MSSCRFDFCHFFIKDCRQIPIDLAAWLVDSYVIKSFIRLPKSVANNIVRKTKNFRYIFEEPFNF